MWSLTVEEQKVGREAIYRGKLDRKFQEIRPLISLFFYQKLMCWTWELSFDSATSSEWVNSAERQGSTFPIQICCDSKGLPMSPLCLLNYPKKREKQHLWESFLFISILFRLVKFK